MSQPNTANWIRPGLLALPLYGLLTLDYTRSPARPEHRLRGLGSLRQHQLLRAEAPAGQWARPDLCDLRCLRFGSLPRKGSRRTPRVGGYGHHVDSQRPVRDDRWDFYLRCAYP